MKCAVSMKRKKSCQNSELANVNGVFRHRLGMSESAHNNSGHANMARWLPRHIWTHESLEGLYHFMDKGVVEAEQVGVRRKHLAATRGWMEGGFYELYREAIDVRQFFR